MDEQIGRILDTLEANGLRENTLVVYTADNGMSMGHMVYGGKEMERFLLICTKHL